MIYKWIDSMVSQTDDAPAHARGALQGEHAPAGLDVQSAEGEDVKSTITADSQKTLTHPHDLLSESEHEALHHRLLVETEREKARLKAEMTQEEQADLEVREFESLLPKFQEQLSHFRDLNFFLTAPSRSAVIEKYPTREAQEAFRLRLIEAQSVYKDIYAEISKRPELSKLLKAESPDFMKQIELICNLGIPEL